MVMFGCFCRVPSLAVCPLARRVQLSARAQAALRGGCLTLSRPLDADGLNSPSEPLAPEHHTPLSAT